MSRKPPPPPPWQPPPPPPDLSPESAALWPGLANDVHETTHGAEVDFLLLHAALQALDRLAQVRAALASEGLTVAGSRNQSRPHPLLSTEAALRREVAQAFEGLRLTYLARPERVSVDANGRLVSRY